MEWMHLLQDAEGEVPGAAPQIQHEIAGPKMRRGSFCDQLKHQWRVECRLLPGFQAAEPFDFVVEPGADLVNRGLFCQGRPGLLDR